MNSSKFTIHFANHVPAKYVCEGGCQSLKVIPSSASSVTSLSVSEFWPSSGACCSRLGGRRWGQENTVLWQVTCFSGLVLTRDGQLLLHRKEKAKLEPHLTMKHTEISVLSISINIECMKIKTELLWSHSVTAWWMLTWIYRFVGWKLVPKVYFYTSCSCWDTFVSSLPGFVTPSQKLASSASLVPVSSATSATSGSKHAWALMLDQEFQCCWCAWKHSFCFRLASAIDGHRCCLLCCHFHCCVCSFIVSQHLIKTSELLWDLLYFTLCVRWEQEERKDEKKREDPKTTNVLLRGKIISNKLGTQGVFSFLDLTVHSQTWALT